MDLNQQVQMVGLNAQLLYLPIINNASLLEQHPQTGGQFPFQHTQTILGNEHKMIQKPMLGMTATPITGGRTGRRVC